MLSDNDEREEEGEGTEKDTTSDNQDEDISHDEEYEDEVYNDDKGYNSSDYSSTSSADNFDQHVTPPDSCDKIAKVCNECYRVLEDLEEAENIIPYRPGGWQCTALGECGIFFMCSYCYKFKQ